MTQTNARGWTNAGLLIALFGIPAVTTLHRMFATDPLASGGIVTREIAILTLTAALLVLVVKGERLPLTSIGIRTDRIGGSLLWGIPFAVACFAAVIACLAIYSVFGIHYGEGQSISRTLPVTGLAVLRAGISEEVLYRGYAIERLQGITGSKWIAAVVSLVLFAGFHFRQGFAGIGIAFVAGAVLTGLYLWKRDLIANMFAHFLVDFIPNVVLPLFGAVD
jgi:membrane protease YdiL (CAAX protease family)